MTEPDPDSSSCPQDAIGRHTDTLFEVTGVKSGIQFISSLGSEQPKLLSKTLHQVHQLESEKERSILYLKAEPNFRLTCFLFVDLLTVLEKANVNRESALVLKHRVLLALDRIGNVSYGLLQTRNSFQLISPLNEVAELSGINGALSRTLRYMSLFTRTDSLIYLLDNDAQLRFQMYDSAIIAETNALLLKYGVMSKYFLAPNPTPYTVTCNLLQRGSPSENLTDVQSLLKISMDALESEAESLTHISSTHLIRHPTVRDFWLKSFCLSRDLEWDREDFSMHFSVTVDSFCGNLKQILNHSVAEEECNSLLERAKNYFQSLPTFDIVVIANATRHISAAETNLGEILKRIVDLGEVGTVRNIPPPPKFKRMVWNDIRSSELKSLLSTRGWVSVVGPQSSGKTTRLLDVVHSLPKERDALWVNLFGIKRAVDVRHRIVSQLSLRPISAAKVASASVVNGIQIPGTSPTEVFSAQLRLLFESLQDGAVIVLDNVPTLADLETDSTATLQDHSSIFSEIFPLSLEYKHKICFVAVSRLPIIIATESPSRIAFSSSTLPSDSLTESDSAFVRSVQFQTLAHDTAREWVETVFNFGPECLPLGTVPSTAVATTIIRAGAAGAGALAAAAAGAVAGAAAGAGVGTGVGVAAGADTFVWHDTLTLADKIAYAGAHEEGRIAALAQCGYVRGIQACLGGSPVIFSAEQCKRFVVHECIHEFTDDERLIAYSLTGDFPHFDLSLAWELCKNAFNKYSQYKLARWLIAWRGLLRRGWLIYEPEIGYKAPPKSIVKAAVDEFLGIGPQVPQDEIGTPVDNDFQGFDRVELFVSGNEGELLKIYLAFWADEARLLNEDMAESSLALLYFAGNYPHFQVLFSSLLSGRLAGDAELRGLAEVLAGNITRILNFCYDASAAAEIADYMVRFVYTASSDARTYGAHLRAVADHCVQLARIAFEADVRAQHQHSPLSQSQSKRSASYYTDALRLLDSAIQKYVVKGERGHQDETARMYAVRGYLLHLQGSYFEARRAYATALHLWKGVALSSSPSSAGFKKDTESCLYGLGFTPARGARLIGLGTVGPYAAPSSTGCAPACSIM